MRRFVIFLLVGVTLIWLFTGCSETARFNKIATELENQGKYREAADNYYSALQAKKENENAYKGLQRTGQKVLNDYVSKFNNLFDFEEYDKSYGALNEIVEYQDKIKKVGVSLRISDEMYAKFQKNKEILASRSYREGTAYVAKSNWRSAINSFLTVKEYLPGYKDVNTQLADCYYNKGSEEFDQKSYRKAYYTFDKCLAAKSHYKDAITQKSKSLEYGKVVIGLFPFVNKTSIGKIDSRLLSQLKSDINRYDSPFIVIKTFNDKKGVTEKNVYSVASNLGIDVALIGEINEPTKKTSRLKKVKADCYETYIETIPAVTKKGTAGYVQVITPSKKIKHGKKTYWYYHTQSRELRHQVSYRLIDLNKHEKLFSSSTLQGAECNIEYGTYPGKKPWALEQFDPEGKAGTALLGLYRKGKSIGTEDYVPMVSPEYFSASKKLKSFDDLAYAFPSRFAKKIAGDVCPVLDKKKYN